jgi:hypothetical protein
MARHDVDVFFTVDNTVVTRPDCATARILVGDTLTFHCPTGELEIHWQNNVFDRDVTRNGDPAKVVKAGPFFGACSVMLPGGKPLHWKGGGLSGKSEAAAEKAASAGIRKDDAPVTRRFTVQPGPGKTLKVSPSLAPVEADRGDRFLFSSPGATLKIEWEPGHPFTKDECTDTVPAVVKRSGPFTGICTLTVVGKPSITRPLHGCLSWPEPIYHRGKSEGGDD